MKLYKNGKLVNTHHETILSMAQIGRSRDTDKFAYCVYVNPDSSREGNPYFKFYNAKSFNKADKVIRLGMKKLEKIKHADGFAYWDIGRKEARVLDAFMSRKSRDYPNYTNWEVTMYLWNREAFFIDDAPDEYNSNIDAYFDGYYDTDENLSHASYIPSNQPQIFYSDSI